MDKIFSETLNQVIIILIPGFISSSIIDNINPKTKYYELVFVLRCLIYGYISNIGLKLIELFFSTDGLLNFIILILFSTILGLFIGVIKYSQKISDLLKKFKILIKSNIPTAWDYVFNKRECNYVIVTLIDDTKIKGWMGENSFASDPEYGCDLFLENVCYKKDNIEWVCDDESKGIYIAKDNIKFIEFKGAKNG